MELDDRELQRLKKIVPYKVLSPTPDEICNEIERLNNIINELSEKNRNLLEDNMRLRKELNLHGGKLYISDIEVKNVF